MLEILVGTLGDSRPGSLVVFRRRVELQGFYCYALLSSVAMLYCLLLYYVSLLTTVVAFLLCSRVQFLAVALTISVALLKG